ncbi:protein-L-isoaspartate O-methyltransferase [Streptomyces fradiae]|uniref:protein-L-isoaspartate O-methyltransferase n=1 Tax=Streptomyces fradiae TaxID=1906 RepID=UPI0037BC5A16
MTVPERHYTHHDGRGATPHRSNPAVIHRELTTLDVHAGMNVAESGTGSGYSGALLAQLVGPTGHVTSLDIDAYLVRWANLIHHERGLDHIRCHVADGTAGFPERAPYDRMVAWCTPPLLPKAWVDQVADGGLIVAPLPIATVPDMTVVAKIRVSGAEPVVKAVFTGGHIEATGSPKDNLDLPGRWVDWENRTPAPLVDLHRLARNATTASTPAPAPRSPASSRTPTPSRTTEASSTGRPGGPSPPPRPTRSSPWPASPRTCGPSGTPPRPRPPSSSKTERSSPTAPTPRPLSPCATG